MSYDPKCYDLAETFGQDHGFTEQEIERLAQHIQSEIEAEIPWILRERTAVVRVLRPDSASLFEDIVQVVRAQAERLREDNAHEHRRVRTVDAGGDRT